VRADGSQIVSVVRPPSILAAGRARMAHTFIRARKGTRAVPRTRRSDGGAAHSLSRLSYSGHVVLRADSSSLTTSSVHPRQSRQLRLKP
jgi:hypothetical protein